MLGERRGRRDTAVCSDQERIHEHQQNTEMTLNGQSTNAYELYVGRYAN